VNSRGHVTVSSTPRDATLAVWAADQTAAVRRRAAKLAAELGLPVAEDVAAGFELLLVIAADRLEVRSTQRRGAGPVWVDFVGGRLGYNRRAGRFGRLFDAIGPRAAAETVLDATAGLGQDAFLLAYHGYRVTAVERSPIVAALLADGLERAAATPELQEAVATRLHLVAADARDYLPSLAPAQAPAVVYLDPMYPRGKQAALVRKELRILRQLVGDDEDAGELFSAARRAARRRVVVKRMRLAPALAPEPSRTYQGRAVRYDVYDV
jgi:16S rRNA (guanine1516-N2)-methyltransferase